MGWGQVKCLVGSPQLLLLLYVQRETQDAGRSKQHAALFWRVVIVQERRAGHPRVGPPRYLFEMVRGNVLELDSQTWR